MFDDKAALLNLHVQKFGRTTKLTKGQITGTPIPHRCLLLLAFFSFFDGGARNDDRDVVRTAARECEIEQATHHLFR